MSGLRNVKEYKMRLLNSFGTAETLLALEEDDQYSFASD